jgi:predicted MFS family arabinose efflux permease
MARPSINHQRSEEILEAYERCIDKFGGAFAFGNVLGLQIYVVKLAERYTPEAVDVASGLNIAAFNLGIAMGAWLGGVIVDKYGLMNTPWVGAIVVVFALVMTRISGSLDRKSIVKTEAVTA